MTVGLGIAAPPMSSSRSVSKEDAILLFDASKHDLVMYLKEAGLSAESVLGRGGLTLHEEEKDECRKRDWEMRREHAEGRHLQHSRTT